MHGIQQDMQVLQRPLRVAHRGGAGLAPENTLAAFRQGLAYHADAVELDLHMSRDGALMVIHDPDLQRLTGTPGEVGGLTLAELQQLNAAATYKDRSIEPQRIPTLPEVFALVQGRAGVQIEIKLRSNHVRYAGIEAKVVELVRQYGMLDDVLVISFDFPILHEITALEPRLPTAALFSIEYLSQFGVGRDEAVVAALQAQGFCRVGANHRYMTPSLYHTLRQHGFSVGVWTVNKEPEIRRFADMGMDFVTSDRPDLLQKWLPSSSH